MLWCDGYETSSVEDRQRLTTAPHRPNHDWKLLSLGIHEALAADDLDLAWLLNKLSDCTVRQAQKDADTAREEVETANLAHCRNFGTLLVCCTQNSSPAHSASMAGIWSSVYKPHHKSELWSGL